MKNLSKMFSYWSKSRDAYYTKAKTVCLTFYLFIIFDKQRAKIFIHKKEYIGRIHRGQRTAKQPTKYLSLAKEWNLSILIVTKQQSYNKVAISFFGTPYSRAMD